MWRLLWPRGALERAAVSLLLNGSAQTISCRSVFVVHRLIDVATCFVCRNFTIIKGQSSYLITM
jgi:hypothetical protein